MQNKKMVTRKKLHGRQQKKNEGHCPFFESLVFRAHDPGIPKVDQLTFVSFRKHFTPNV